MRAKRKARLVLGPLPSVSFDVRLREALERVRAAAESVLDHQVRVVHIDMLTAAGKVRAVAPRLRTLRDQLAALPGFDVARFDRLDTCARRSSTQTSSRRSSGLGRLTLAQRIRRWRYSAAASPPMSCRKNCRADCAPSALMMRSRPSAD